MITDDHRGVRVLPDIAGASPAIAHPLDKEREMRTAILIASLVISDAIRDNQITTTTAWFIVIVFFIFVFLDLFDISKK